MLKSLAAEEPLVKATFDEADRVMTPLLGRPLTSFIFVDGDDPAAVQTLNQQLMQTEITQPAVLATDIALTRLLAAYGVQPDMVMGHSLGEYGALVAAGALTLDSALEAVSARGREMTKVSVADNGAMAAVFAPMAEIQRVVDQADGYVVIANINSTSQAVVGGRHRRRRADHRAVHRRGLHRHPDPGQPRLPHLDRRAGVRAVRRRAAPARPAGRRRSRSSPT